MNTNPYSSLTPKTLRQVADLMDVMDGAQADIERLLRTNGNGNGLTANGKRIGRPPKQKRAMSAEARHKISLAAKRRWKLAHRLGKSHL